MNKYQNIPLKLLIETLHLPERLLPLLPDHPRLRLRPDLDLGVERVRATDEPLGVVEHVRKRFSFLGAEVERPEDHGEGNEHGAFGDVEAGCERTCAKRSERVVGRS
jgi:hypothetical protein